MDKKNKHLNYEDRRKIEKLFNSNVTITEIAKEISHSRVAITNEVRRGLKKMRTSKGKIVERYYAEYAQQLYESTQSNKLQDLRDSGVISEISSQKPKKKKKDS